MVQDEFVPKMFGLFLSGVWDTLLSSFINNINRLFINNKLNTGFVKCV